MAVVGNGQERHFSPIKLGSWRDLLVPLCCLGHWQLDIPLFEDLVLNFNENSAINK